MKETFLNLLNYLKNPTLESDTNLDIKYRFKIFFKILAISILTGFVVAPVFAILEELSLVDMDNHKLQQMFEGMSKIQIILMGAIAAPIIEELIFRAPITFFKNPKSFKIGFYFFALTFGFIHITNFNLTPTILLVSPILVLPQILLGGYFGYVRVRLGLQWSILLHGTYNGILILLSFIPEN